MRRSDKAPREARGFLNAAHAIFIRHTLASGRIRIMRRGKIGMLWKLRTLLRHPKKMLRAFRDPRTPLIARVLPVVALFYVLFPLDMLPDFIPFLGQIDDISIALYLVSYALSLVPDEAFARAGFESPQRRV